MAASISSSGISRAETRVGFSRRIGHGGDTVGGVTLSYQQGRRPAVGSDGAVTIVAAPSRAFAPIKVQAAARW